VRDRACNVVGSARRLERRSRLADWICPEANSGLKHGRLLKQQL